MEMLPLEILFMIAESLEEIRDILAYCSDLFVLWHDDNFWRRIYRHPEISEPPYITWRKSYRVLMNSRQMKIHIDSRRPRRLKEYILSVSPVHLRGKNFSAVDIHGKLYIWTKKCRFDVTESPPPGPIRLLPKDDGYELTIKRSTKKGRHIEETKFSVTLTIITDNDIIIHFKI